MIGGAPENFPEPGFSRTELAHAQLHAGQRKRGIVIIQAEIECGSQRSDCLRRAGRLQQCQPQFGKHHRVCRLQRCQPVEPRRTLTVSAKGAQRLAFLPDQPAEFTAMFEPRTGSCQRVVQFANFAQGGCQFGIQRRRVSTQAQSAGTHDGSLHQRNGVNAVAAVACVLGKPQQCARMIRNKGYQRPVVSKRLIDSTTRLRSDRRSQVLLCSQPRDRRFLPCCHAMRRALPAPPPPAASCLPGTRGRRRQPSRCSSPCRQCRTC